MLRAFSVVAIAHAAKYVLDESFPDLSGVPEAILANFSNVRCVAFDGTDLHAVHLGTPPILTFSSATGAFQRAWGTDALVHPHGCVHHDGELWVADAINDPSRRLYGDFTVRRVSVATGALLTKLGRSGYEGSGRHPFELAEVTDVAWGSGALFISDGGDGDGLNERVSRLDGESYEPIWIRGTNGTVDTSDDPVGNFSQLHSVTVDESRNRVWLADRGHDRIVALDASTGAFVGAWPCVKNVNGAGPNSVRWDAPRDRLVVSVGNGGPGREPKASSYVFALEGASPPGACVFASPPLKTATTDNAHEIAIDEKTGDLYVAFEDDKLGMPRRYHLA